MGNLGALRAVLVTGKGGVGKTTVATAIARAVASQGKRVLCAEMEASSEDAGGSQLATALGIATLGDEPTEVLPGLRAMVLRPALGHQQFLRDVLPMKVMADAAMRSAAIRRFFSAAPTFPEMGTLYRLLDLVRRRRKDKSFEHEVIVVDLPATGHALALAQIPASLLRVMPTGPIAAAVGEGLSLLRDPARTGAVVVTLPETLPVSEALELARGIDEHRIPLARVVMNRVPHDPFAPGEAARVRARLQGAPPTLGVRTMDRIDRAAAAVARLRAGVRAPVDQVHETFAEGPRVAEFMARQLAEVW